MIWSRGQGLKRQSNEIDFRFKHFRHHFKTILIFVTIFMSIYVLFGTLAAKQHLFDYSFPFPLTNLNIMQWFVFQLLISNLEEIFFRYLVILILLKLWSRLFTKPLHLQIAVVAASTLIFAMRHIGFILYPFEITYLVPLHILVVSVMGIFLGIIFIKTRSFWAVYTSHGLINGCILAFLLTLNIMLG
ncbi:type II CAAX prenyl endopeptidase Rce1 family protein [Paenibacillus sp. sgz500958]|uniref:CPBP family glutamic-type intramembrane protease n=1 Tax=Paenibacillus sp. sgz500958 TaxID=3242475 RepID=UPI0036D24ECE